MRLPFFTSLNVAHEYTRNYIPLYVRRADSSNNGISTVYVSGSVESPDSNSIVSTDVSTKSKCPTCGRLHFGVCWGPKKERSPWK